MLKKRLIFTLLFNDGHFVLSRNFRLQKVGDLRWLQTHYNFSRISFFIDELIVLNVSRVAGSAETFRAALKVLAEGCFVPITAGGGVRSVGEARDLLRSGADKVAVNTALFDGSSLVDELASVFGQQCVVASVDVKRGADAQYRVWTACGSRAVPGTAIELLANLERRAVGELYLNSIDRDGTGQGYELGLLDLLPTDLSKPVILAGGVGNGLHLGEGIADPRVDAVATAHLFNFVGDGLQKARQSLLSSGVILPVWDVDAHQQLFRPLTHRQALP